jgi:hypothetical protein
MNGIKLPVPGNEPISDTPVLPIEPTTTIAPVAPDATPITPEPVTPPSTSTIPDVTPDVEIDGVIYKLNENGDAITDDGNIFMDKAKLTELANVPVETEITNIAKIVNVQPLDDKGTPIEYENTVDGIAQYINDVVNVRSQEVAQSIEQQFFEQNPDLYQVYLHKLTTGSIEGFNEHTDWSNIDIATAEEDVLKSIIIANETRKGTDKGRAEYLANLIKADGKLKEQSIFAQKELADYNKEYQNNALAIQQQREAEETAEINAYWNNVEHSVKSGKLTLGEDTFKLPQVFRIKQVDGKVTTATNQDFLDYMNKTKVFEIEGKQYELTQNYYDSLVENSKRTHEHDVYDALKRFVKGDVSQFIQEQVKQNEVKRLILSTKQDNKRGNTPGEPGTRKLNLPVK